MTGLLIILGVIAALFAALLLAGIVGQARFYRRFIAEATASEAAADRSTGPVVTPAELRDLPPPVQRYLRYAGVVGRPRIRTVVLSQTGRLRLAPGGTWHPFVAAERYTVDPPSFHWLGTIRPAPLLHVAARDRYAGGRGNMLIKLLSLITVANATGPQLDAAAALRFLNEAVWHPTTFLADYVHWEAIDDRTARVTLTDGALTVAAVCAFDGDGRMVDFVADRFDSDSGQVQEWHTPLVEYAEHHGLRVPVRGSAYYRLADGNFEYIDLALAAIEYDADGPAR